MKEKFPKVGKNPADFSKGWKILTSIFLLLVAVAGFWLSGRMNEPMIELRRQYRLDQAAPLENSPPLVAFTTVAIGGFRGILADILWIRASTLQDQGKYVELVQLADWITKLEPRLADVWAFQAWNLAYNVSAFFNTPEDRWRWVRHGITLLRDEGLRYNPGSASLCRELAWMFQHKIGGTQDEMHRVYKRAWAAEMSALFDGPRPDYAHLPAEASNRLTRIYKLNPAVMEQIDREYGPVDWRLPPAHSLYWALQSRRVARGWDIVAANRMIYQAMANQFREGALLFRPEEGVFVTRPNLDVLPEARTAYETAIAENPGETAMTAAYDNFLGDAIVILFTHDRPEEARRLLDEFRARHPGEPLPADLDAFVCRVVTRDAARLSYEEALGLLERAELQSVFWQALGEDAQARGFHRLTEICRRHIVVDSGRELPSPDQIRRTARERLLANPPSSRAAERLR